MEPETLWRGVKKFVKNDSLSIALFSLFLLSIAGQAVSGWFAYNAALRTAGFHAIGLAAWLRTGHFLDGVFANWQAAVLQLAVLIAFSSVLRQKGAAHSLKPEAETHRRLIWKITRRKSGREWLRANSLGLAFFGMFIVTFALHSVFGTWDYNEDLMLRHLPGISWASYLVSSSFWASVFETWEAEFAIIGTYVVLSIFLRQERSPESKPVDASNTQTGVTNK